MSKVFVYGTLKNGFVNEPFLADQEYIGKAVLSNPCWQLYEVRGRYDFPALVQTEEGHGYKVYGELYDVNDACLRMMDQLEGVEIGLYDRTFVEVDLEDGQTVEGVIAYRFLREIKTCSHVGPVWPNFELSKYRWIGHQLQKREDEVEIEGVALWDKKLDDWKTKAFETIDELQKACWPARLKYGANPNQQEAWCKNWFEARPRKLNKTEIILQLICPNGKTSPKFPNRNQVAEWAAENTEFFGGEKGNPEDWKKVLLEACPVIDD